MADLLNKPLTVKQLQENANQACSVGSIAGDPSVMAAVPGAAAGMEFGILGAAIGAVISSFVLPIPRNYYDKCLPAVDALNAAKKLSAKTSKNNGRS